MSFLTEPEPQRGVPETVAAGVLRLVAANSGPMTYHGTNTYLIEGKEGVSVLDPGPDDPAHTAAIVAAAPGAIVRIIVSHTHSDHIGGVAALKAATGAPSWGFRDSAAPQSFTADHALDDGDTVAGLVALHTPGHAPDHLCFARADDGLLFSADHVMSWSTSVVPPPPHGDMAAYFASLRRLLERADSTYLPGHGPPLTTPHPFVRDLLRHRIMREDAILEALRRGADTTGEITERLYSQVNPVLRRAAERNVVAHLTKLAAEGRAAQEGGRWVSTEG